MYLQAHFACQDKRILSYVCRSISLPEVLYWTQQGIARRVELQLTKITFYDVRSLQIEKSGRCYLTLSREDGNRFSFRNAVFFQNIRRRKKPDNPVIPRVISSESFRTGAGYRSSTLISNILRCLEYLAKCKKNNFILTQRVICSAITLQW
jgi:hypothetical protein